MGEEARLEHDVEHGIACCHSERVAAESRSMGAGYHADRGAFGGKTGADREAVSKRFGDRHDIGWSILPFVREQLAGAPHPALYFVIDEQQAELVGDLAQPAK